MVVQVQVPPGAIATAAGAALRVCASLSLSLSPTAPRRPRPRPRPRARQHVLRLKRVVQHRYRYEDDVHGGKDAPTTRLDTTNDSNDTDINTEDSSSSSSATFPSQSRAEQRSASKADQKQKSKKHETRNTSKQVSARSQVLDSYAVGGSAAACASRIPSSSSRHRLGSARRTHAWIAHTRSHSQPVRQ